MPTDATAPADVTAPGCEQVLEATQQQAAWPRGCLGLEEKSDLMCRVCMQCLLHLSFQMHLNQNQASAKNQMPKLSPRNVSGAGQRAALGRVPVGRCPPARRAERPLQGRSPVSLRTLAQLP